MQWQDSLGAPEKLISVAFEIPYDGHLRVHTYLLYEVRQQSHFSSSPWPPIYWHYGI